jgi:hypothetical protein
VVVMRFGLRVRLVEIEIPRYARKTAPLRMTQSYDDTVI